MWRLIKLLLSLLILAAVAMVVYAYVGPVIFVADFAAPTTEVRAPVTLEVK